jgi:hypothetical protein
VGTGEPAVPAPPAAFPALLCDPPLAVVLASGVDAAFELPVDAPLSSHWHAPKMPLVSQR